MAYTAIDDPSAHFQVTLYTGNGSANHAITNDGLSDLQPDLVWIKNRDAADANCVFDSNRGATVIMYSNASTADATDADTLDSFASDGFQVDADVKVNTNTEKYVAWQWKANGGSTSANTTGTNIDSVVQANTTAGFSIVTFDFNGSTGGTVGHGLGAVPSVIIVKNRENVADWQMFWQSLGEENRIQLNTTAAVADNSLWADTAPTSTVFSVGNSAEFNTTADDQAALAYCWTPIQGYSKFGEYTGNGAADGTFVYTGFKPAWVMLHEYTSGNTNDSFIYDIKRSTFNAMDDILLSNEPDAETTGRADVDFLSNGFKCRATHADTNRDDGTFLYMAFAHQPLVTSDDGGSIPCTAH